MSYGNPRIKHLQENMSVCSPEPWGLATAPRCLLTWQWLSCSPRHMPSAVQFVKGREAGCLPLFFMQAGLSWIRGIQHRHFFIEVYESDFSQVFFRLHRDAFWVLLCMPPAYTTTLISPIKHIRARALESLSPTSSETLGKVVTSLSLSFLICEW